MEYYCTVSLLLMYTLNAYSYWRLHFMWTRVVRLVFEQNTLPEIFTMSFLLKTFQSNSDVYLSLSVKTRKIWKDNY